MKVSVALLPLALGAGVIGGLALGGRAPATPPPAGPPRVVTVAAGVDMAQLRGAIRDVLREELRTALPPVDRPAAAPEPAEAPPPTTEQTAAYNEARALVDRGMAGGTWDSDRGMTLRGLLAVVTVEQRDELLHTLTPALNSGAVRLVGPPGPPF
jgi:hypothetical protein